MMIQKIISRRGAEDEVHFFYDETEHVLKIIFTMDNIKIYMSRPTLFDIPDDTEIRFNDSDVVVGRRGYNAWWSKEYERREADDL